MKEKRKGPWFLGLKTFQQEKKGGGGGANWRMWGGEGRLSAILISPRKKGGSEKRQERKEGRQQLSKSQSPIMEKGKEGGVKGSDLGEGGEKRKKESLSTTRPKKKGALHPKKRGKGAKFYLSTEI